jgi:hypothetical protein
MAFVPGSTYDVFISYARLDNIPLAGASEGWVSTFAENLKNTTARKLGCKELELWMDYRLKGNEGVTPAIMEALGESATLVVLVSPGYLNSDWCRRERQTFLAHLRRRLDVGSRLFLVELDEVKRDDNPDYPEEFTELIGYRFWVAEGMGGVTRTLGTPDPQELEYYKQLISLSDELARELARLKANAGGGQTREGEADGASVFLAEVTEDLDPQRDDVRTYLVQAGLRVLPETWYPRDDPEAFRKAVDRDIRRCKLFVQLLSGTVGRRPPGLPQGYARYQYERALEEKRLVIQWRDQGLSVAAVPDKSHRELLEGVTVRAVGIEEFKRAAVAEAARAASPPPPVTQADAFIFVDSDSPDYRLARKVADVLEKYEVGYALPQLGGTPAAIRRELEDCLKSCDGLIVIYGETTVKWVRNQLMQGRKIMSQRAQPLRALAIYEGPPAPKPPLDFRLPRMRTLVCHHDLDESALLDFLRSLKG